MGKSERDERKVTLRSVPLRTSMRLLHGREGRRHSSPHGLLLRSSSCFHPFSSLTQGIGFLQDSPPENLILFKKELFRSLSCFLLFVSFRCEMVLNSVNIRRDEHFSLDLPEATIHPSNCCFTMTLFSPSLWFDNTTPLPIAPPQKRRSQDEIYFRYPNKVPLLYYVYDTMIRLKIPHRKKPQTQRSGRTQPTGPSEPSNCCFTMTLIPPPFRIDFISYSYSYSTAAPILYYFATMIVSLEFGHILNFGGLFSRASSHFNQ